MIKQLTILFLLISSSLFSQTELNLDNNLAGIYSDSKSGQQIGLNFSGSNTISKNKVSIDFGTNYLIRYNKLLTDNELIQRVNIGYNKEKYDMFITYQYNYSLSRSISSDNWIGVGGGLKKKFDSGKISLSYAFIFQNTDYFIKANDEMFRNSFRLKFKIEKKFIGFSTEYYYQPSFIDFNDATFSSATISASCALVYNTTQSSKAVVVLDFGGTKTSTNGDFTIQFPTPNSTSAVLRIS
jgi:hypothetical protein